MECLGLDVETYSNFFTVCLLRFRDGANIVFEKSERTRFDASSLSAILHSNVIVTFNGNNYDLPIIELALRGWSNEGLKVASDLIIKSDLQPWEVRKQLGVRGLYLNHVDLMGPCPAVRQSLKLIAGRLHARTLQDLPFEPDTELTHEQMDIVTSYCFNDLEHTRVLRDALREPLKLRIETGRTYGCDFRSKSDAQMGEAIVKLRVEQALGRPLPRVEQATHWSFRYEPPDWVWFDLNGPVAPIVEKLRERVFKVIDGVVVKDAEDKHLITIGGSTYSMGIGGLHSVEAHRAIEADANRVLLDCDVASQYPNIISKLGMYPKLMGPAFLDVYRELIIERLEAKDIGDKTKADGLKIALNGVYGKLGSPYSALYSPNMMIAVTLTGQLSLLMLIERCEEAGIPIVSGNTDGIVAYPLRTQLDAFWYIVERWQATTGFVLEHTEYRAIYNSCVNTYIALKADGKVKTKGWIADPVAAGDLRTQMQKNPQASILGKAVIEAVAHSIPLEETIKGCTDPRQIVSVRNVRGGAEWRGEKLGRVVRFYWSTDGDPITYCVNGNKVPKTDGSRPLMVLPDEIPADIDLARYLAEAEKLAIDLGILKGEDDGKVSKLPRKRKDPACRAQREPSSSLLPS